MFYPLQKECWSWGHEFTNHSESQGIFGISFLEVAFMEQTENFSQPLDGPWVTPVFLVCEREPGQEGETH